MTTYPYGYQSAEVTLDRLKILARWDLLEPEFGDRMEAWLLSRGGHIGIGGAVRFIQPVGPTFAPAGMSFHEQQRFNDGTVWFAAFDLVCRREGGGVHRAPYWSEVPKQGTSHQDIIDFGVHCNVPGEPWHIQPIELDGYGSWEANGRPRPNPNFKIKGTTPPPPTPPPNNGEYALGSRVLRIASPTMRGNDVMWVQQTLKNQGLSISTDGYYGRQTADRVKIMQGWNGLTKDGIVGPKTWEVLKRY